MPPSTSDLRWHALLSDFRKSGLTHAAFCELRDISLHSFRKRLYASRPAGVTAPPGEATPTAEPVFLSVTVLSDAHDPAPQPLELILPGGRRVAVPRGFDAETLRRVLAVLEGRPC